MDQIENLKPTEANEWLRITNNVYLKSRYPSDDVRPGGRGDDEGCGGGPSAPSEEPPDPPEGQPAGDSPTKSD